MGGPLRRQPVPALATSGGLACQPACVLRLRCLAQPDHSGESKEKGGKERKREGGRERTNSRGPRGEGGERNDGRTREGGRVGSTKNNAQAALETPARLGREGGRGGGRHAGGRQGGGAGEAPPSGWSAFPEHSMRVLPREGGADRGGLDQLRRKAMAVSSLAAPADRWGGSPARSQAARGSCSLSLTGVLQSVNRLLSKTEGNTLFADPCRLARSTYGF